MRKLCFLALISPLCATMASAATLHFVGAGTLIDGTGAANNMNIGDSVLFANAGIDDNLDSYDIIITLNNKSTGTTLDSTQTNAAFHLTGQADAWADLTMFFIQSGSSTELSPFGTKLIVQGVTSFVAKDIDSEAGQNFTDVFGLYDAPGTISLGSASLQQGGFINNEGSPTTGVNYVRATPNSTNNWTTNINAPTTDPDYFATWNYASVNIEEFRFVWGVTSPTDNLAISNRGMLGEINFTNIAIPEPSSALLLSLAATGLSFRRRQRAV